MANHTIQAGPGAGSPELQRRSLPAVLKAVHDLAANSPNLVINSGATFEVDGERYELPRFLFIGPKGGGDPIRLGIFAGLHGDEPDGAHAVVEFIKLLEFQPELASGYCLSLYPICNPTGFEDGSRASRAGKNLDEEFWKNSAEPEVRLLQAELITRSFHGIIVLRTDEKAEGLCGWAAAPMLRQHLIEPAQRAAEVFLPRDGRLSSDAALQSGVIGGISAPPKVRLRPFEITLATPKTSPPAWNRAGLVVALEQILIQYRNLISYAQNI